MANFFLEIVNMSITASYLIVAVIMLRLVLAKAPKWIRGILWGLVGIRLVVPFSFESMFSLMPEKSPIPTDTVQNSKIGMDTGVPSAMWDFSTSAGAAPQSTDVAGTLAPIEETVQSATIAWTDFLAIVWLAGIIVMLSYCIISYIRLNRRMADAVIYNGGLCADGCTRDVSEKYGKKYSIYQSEKVVSPFVLGFFMPRIYIPFQMGAKDMECVIAHEKAHIARKDHWIKPIAFMILSFYWFNPLVWVAYILLCRDMELACDEKVIKEMGIEHKKAYSEALLKCSAPGRMISACPLAFGEVGVKKRIVNILNYKKPAFWIVLVSILLCVVVAVCFMTKPKEQTIPYINDGSVEWENVDEIIIYSDGYYGRTLEEPLVITDEETLQEFIEATLDANEYREVEDGEQLEGLSVIFIDYQNGTVLSMYSEPNYGMISDTMQTTGATCYYVPKDLYDKVIDILKDETKSVELEEVQLSSELEAVEEQYLQQQIAVETLSTELQEVRRRLENERIKLAQLEQEAALKELIEQQEKIVQDLAQEEEVMLALLEQENVKLKVLEERQEILGEMSSEENSFETVTSVQILKEPPTLTMQDALSSAINFTYVENGTYEWNYSTGKPNEMVSVNASGPFPTVAVKGKEDEWIEVRDYNGIDYAPYMLNWGIDPDRIYVVEYDLLDLGDMEPLVLDEYTLEDVYFLELRPRRIYEIIARWDEGSNGNGFYGEATYIFATDNYAVSGTVAEGEGQPVLIQATIKEVMADAKDKICITSESENFPGAFVVQIPEDVYPIDALQGGQAITLSMKDTGEMYDEHLPLYTALILRVHYSDAGTLSEDGNAMSGMNLPAVVDTPWEHKVNTLDGVSLSMEKYTDLNGDLEINNQLRLNLLSSGDVGKVLQTGAWFTIQRKVDGAWYDLAPIAEVAWHQIAYEISAGETTVLPVTWEYLYGELPTGEYRIVISIQDWRAPGDFDTYYLADEFEIMKSY